MFRYDDEVDDELAAEPELDEPEPELDELELDVPELEPEEPDPELDELESVLVELLATADFDPASRLSVR